MQNYVFSAKTPKKKHFFADNGSGVKLTVCLPTTVGIRTAAGVVYAVQLVPVVVIFAVMFFSLGKNA